MAEERVAVVMVGDEAVVTAAATMVGVEAVATAAAATGEPKADASAAAATVAAKAAASVVLAMAVTRAGLAGGAERVAWAGEGAGMVEWVATAERGGAGSAAWEEPTEAVGGAVAGTAAVRATGVRRGGCGSAHRRRPGAPSSSWPTARPAPAEGAAARASLGVAAGTAAEWEGRG